MHDQHAIIGEIEEQIFAVPSHRAQATAFQIPPRRSGSGTVREILSDVKLVAADPYHLDA